MTDTVAAVIPARYGSERFPGKPLAPIDGTPMVVRVLRNAESAAGVDTVMVATDDERIAAAVRDAGGKAVMTPRGVVSGSDRVWAAVAETPADIVVNVQGDEPLVSGSIIDALVDRLRAADGYEISTPVVATPRLVAAPPDVVTVARDDDGHAMYFSRSIVPFGADPVWRHIGVYAYRRSALEQYVATRPTTLEKSEGLEQLRALALGLRIAAVEVDAVTHAVDRLEDIAAVERILASGEPVGVTCPRLVVLDVDGVLTDGAISYLPDGGQLVTFDVKDGYGVVAMMRAGIEVVILTARDSPALHRRAEELGITELRVGIDDKESELRRLADARGMALDEVCFVADDDPDLPAMAVVGLSVAPADASPAVRARARLVLQREGGRGAVRELADLLLERLVPTDPPTDPGM